MISLFINMSVTRTMIGIIFVMALIAFSLSSTAFAARPLITDDAGTIGKGKYQIEAGFETSDLRQDYDDTVTKERTTNVTTTLSYGILENLDIIAGLPHDRTKVSEDYTTVQNEQGFADVTLEAKWRFFEKEGLALALKPGLSFPTGNHEKGLGNGRMTYAMLFIVTKDLQPFSFNLNVGYRRNENRTDERNDLWGADIAGEVRILKPLKLVCNIGATTNKDRESVTAPAFALGGLVYTVMDDVDIDLAYKKGLNKAEADNTYIIGLTVKF